MNEKLKQRLRTGVVIVLIYVLFILYLLLVSNRVEKLDSRSEDAPVYYSLKIGA